MFSGDESTWGDWSFKLRSYVSVVDLQLGRMMEAAELAAHASVRIPSGPLKTTHGCTGNLPARHVRQADPLCRSSDNSQAEYRHYAIFCSKVQSAFASPFPGTVARDHAF